MSDEKIIIPKRNCMRCQHNWTLRKPTEPIICPECKSPYWNKPRKNKE